MIWRSVKHLCCRELLKMARADARAKRVHIPLGLWVHKTLRTYEVHGDNSILWHGQACCKYDAKANAITATTASAGDKP